MNLRAGRLVRASNLWTGDQATVDSLPERLADEVSLDRACFDQIENRPQWASELEALRGLYVALGQIGVVQDENPGNLAVAAKTRRNGHVQLRRIQIRQIVEAERRVVTVYTLDLLVPIPRPQRPKDEVGPVRRRKQRDPVNAAVLADPIPDLHVIRVCVFGESCRLGLLRGEEALLLLGDLEEPPRRFAMRLGHNTILQLL